MPSNLVWSWPLYSNANISFIFMEKDGLNCWKGHATIGFNHGLPYNIKKYGPYGPTTNNYASPVYNFCSKLISKTQPWTSHYLISSHANLQRAMPGTRDAWTSSYWPAMPSNRPRVAWISSIFRGRAMAELNTFLISAAMFPVMFVIWQNLFCIHSGYLVMSRVSISANL